MVDFTINTPNMSIARLKIMNPDRFYNQDWYNREEFFYKTMKVGDYGLGGNGASLPTAAILVYDIINTKNRFDMNLRLDLYVWTCDRDLSGNRVYVGNINGLIQIHRHLSSPRIEDRYYRYPYNNSGFGSRTGV